MTDVWPLSHFKKIDLITSRYSAIEPTLVPEDSLLKEEETPEWAGESQIESIDKNSSNFFLTR